jgi:hypothetical protein
VYVFEEGLPQPFFQGGAFGNCTAVFCPGVFDDLAGGVLEAVFFGVGGEVEDAVGKGVSGCFVEDTFAVCAKTSDRYSNRVGNKVSRGWIFVDGLIVREEGSGFSTLRLVAPSLGHSSKRNVRVV